MDEKVLLQINPIFKKYGEIERVVLYGSRAKGNYKPGSDYDITLVGNNINLSILNKISLDIDDLLLPYKFDISIFNHIKNTELIEHIHRVGITIFSKD